MKNLLRSARYARAVLFSVVPLVLFSSTASAGLMLGGNELTNSGAGSVANNALVFDFVDQGSNTIRLTMSATSGGGAFNVTQVLFNVDPAIANLGLDFAYVSGVETKSNSGTPEFDADAFGMGGPLTGFDIEFIYKQNADFSENGNTTSVYDITASGPNASSISAASFDFANPNGHFGAVHLNHPNDGDDSGKYGTPRIDPLVPEPASLAIWGFGIFALAGARRVRKSTV